MYLLEKLYYCDNAGFNVKNRIKKRLPKRKLHRGLCTSRAQDLN